VTTERQAVCLHALCVMKLAYRVEKEDKPCIVIFTALSNCTDISQKPLSVQQYSETLLFFSVQGYSKWLSEF